MLPFLAVLCPAPCSALRSATLVDQSLNVASNQELDKSPRQNSRMKTSLAPFDKQAGQDYIISGDTSLPPHGRSLPPFPIPTQP